MAEPVNHLIMEVDGDRPSGYALWCSPQSYNDGDMEVEHAHQSNCQECLRYYSSWLKMELASVYSIMAKLSKASNVGQ